jgi:hypothetical protein
MMAMARLPPSLPRADSQGGPVAASQTYTRDVSAGRINRRVRKFPKF